VTGHAFDSRILDRLDDNVVAEPVDSHLADLLGKCRSAETKRRSENKSRDQAQQLYLL
jgi:hypothetical protein